MYISLTEAHYHFCAMPFSILLNGDHFKLAYASAFYKNCFKWSHCMFNVNLLTFCHLSSRL
jgi:hypothetical protein